MESVAFQWEVLIAALLTSVIAGYVGAAWMRDSRFRALSKRMIDCEQATADLESSFSSLLESHKRLRSRTGMRELRERDATASETKAETRRRLFGTTAGPAFAKIQASLNANHPNRPAETR
jgi:hypothetical protein